MQAKASMGMRESAQKDICRTTKRLIPLSGRVRWTHRRDGEVIGEGVVQNLIVYAGEDEAAKLLGGVAGGEPFTWIAMGTGTTAPAKSDVALEEEITTGGLERKQDTSPEATDNVLSVSVTFNVTSQTPIPVTEAGLFNAGTGGDMFARVTFAAINLMTPDTLTWTWEITVGEERV